LPVVFLLLAGLSACAAAPEPVTSRAELLLLDRELASPDPTVRAATVSDLAREQTLWSGLPSDLVLERLVTALLDEDDGVHDAAAEALCRLYPNDPAARALVLVANWGRRRHDATQTDPRPRPTRSRIH